MYKTKRALITISLATATFFGGSSLASMQDTTSTNNQTNQNNSAQNGNRRANGNRSNGNRSNGNMSGGNMSGGNMSSGNMSGGSGSMGGGMNSGGMTGGAMGGGMMGGSMNALDNDFAMMAAMGGQAEIQMAQLAVQRSTNRDVQRYAQRMIKDHTSNARDLQKAATRSGNTITLPTAPSTEMMQMMAPLQQASGAEFDRMYMQMAGVQAHTMMRQLFSNQATNGTNNDLKRYAQKTLPVIDRHLRMAQDVNLTGGAGMTNGGSMNNGGGTNRNTSAGGGMNSNNNNR